MRCWRWSERRLRDASRVQCDDLDYACDDVATCSAPRTTTTLNLSLDGWEGPLDLLLTLARAQKVDLHAISILALVEQYLAYHRAGARRCGWRSPPIIS